MQNKKLNIQRLIFEFISVSFAVLIALLVNQWREDHNNGKLAEKAIYNIKQELQENKIEFNCITIFNYPLTFWVYFKIKSNY